VPRLSGRVKLNKGVKTATEFVEFYPIVFITLSDAFSVVEHNDWIHNKLSKIAADMKSDVGRIPGSVPTLAYVEWASNDSEACSQWLQLFLNYKKACQEMTNS
jgi:hypothetical protein